MLRERVIEQYEKGIVATAGLFAHGRGEAFDYLLGEKTQGQAIEAVEAAAAALLTSEYPVISVNGNAAALCAKEMIELSKMVDAKVEVNLFYRSEERELAIKRLLELHGATEVLG
ncbi:MAG: DUF137 domain-containing protein, partial [Nitrososphaeria archaeon]|nr:DUF137 domain-containing protein [Nitrososphaeria archaeon]NIN51622.1 DUF137 domain-containing protein [Nitrososphaeria archaeon]NIQ32107.1 DUF137 domain-containing protein [Nitrososphaeria archaeon]